MSAEAAGLGSVGLALCLCGALLLGGAWLLLSVFRRHGAILLPLYQMFFGRKADDEELRRPTSTFAPAQKPDLRAIAREQDFDAALRAQEAGPTAPPGFETPSFPTIVRGQSFTPADRSRDEDDEFGFDTLSD